VFSRRQKVPVAEFTTLRPRQTNAPKILLVDDDPMQLRIRETVLRGAGFEVCIATSGESALAILRARHLGDMIGTVVTDHLMPGLSGPEFVSRVRELNPIIPVNVLSGMPDAEAEYEGLNIIFRPKPCPPPQLIALVRESVHKAA
jgi:CheY-like chemotaxis protein